MLGKYVALVALLSVGLAACSSTPTTEEATEGLCSGLASLEAAVAEASAIGPDSSVDDAEAAGNAIKDAWDGVKEDAEVVNEAAAQEASDAADEFNDAIGDISGESSLAGAAAQALTAAQDFRTALDSIESSISCQ